MVDVHHLDELGPLEATWIFEVEDFGPFVVDIDSAGNNLFDRLNADVKLQFKKAYEKYGIIDYTYI